MESSSSTVRLNGSPLPRSKPIFHHLGVRLGVGVMSRWSCVMLSLCVGIAFPVHAEGEPTPGTVVKFKHKVQADEEFLVVHFLVNDIESDDPRSVALRLSADPTLEVGAQFLTKDLISDYARAPGMIGMPVLSKLKVNRLDDVQGKFAIVTIRTSREIFETGDQSLALVRSIGEPDCVSDLFRHEEDPNDDVGSAMRIGSFKPYYCVEDDGSILSDGLGEGLRDIDRFQLRVKEDVVIESVLTHEGEHDIDMAISRQSDGELLEQCERANTPERCVIQLRNVSEPIDLEIMLIAVSGVGHIP